MAVAVEGGVVLAQCREGLRRTVAAKQGGQIFVGVTTTDSELAVQMLGLAQDLYSRKGAVHVKHKGVVLYLAEGAPRWALFKGAKVKGVALGLAGLWLASELLQQPISHTGRAGRLNVPRGAYLAHQYRQRTQEDGMYREAAYRYYRRFITEAVIVRDIIQQENDHE